jgi:hypothetical protein
MALTQVTAGLLDNSTQTYGMKNRIINGDMRIDQRNAGASVNSASGGTFAVDRFASFASGGGVYTTQRSTDVPTGQGFTNSIASTVTTIDSPTGTDYYVIQHSIEGFNTSDFGWGTASAKSVTVSFWVKSSLTGTYTVAFRNSALNRSYRATYTITLANTWEKKSITIPGDTSGTWLTDNSSGIRLGFTLGAGADYIDTGNTWSGLEDFAATGQTQWIATLGATFYVTGVQLEAGTTATAFDYRPYGTELQLCQRYCENIIASGTNPALWSIQAGANNNSRGGYFYKVQKRASPSFTNLNGTAYLCQYTSGNFVPSAINLAASNPNGMLIDSVCSGLTAGQAGFQLEGTISAGTIICFFSAEL